MNIRVSSGLSDYLKVNADLRNPEVMLAIEEKRGTFDSDAPNFYNLCGGAGVQFFLSIFFSKFCNIMQS